MSDGVVSQYAILNALAVCIAIAEDQHGTIERGAINVRVDLTDETLAWLQGLRDAGRGEGA